MVTSGSDASAELSPRYEPAAVESNRYREWEAGGCFGAHPDERTPFTIVIPPPNVTGVLHMGHALNNTIQDIVIRWRRMAGDNALWLPGTDHAGIATQNVVERHLATEDTTRQDIGREAFIEAVWDWRRQYGSRIIEQLKRMGSSCDWSRERFTMDEGLSRAVREAFVHLHRKGLIYRGHYMINWCPRCHTALSDEEVEHEEHEGHLWHIRYPFRDEPTQSITVATTRPETMLGDTAVAVNPDDERYRDMIGKILTLPVIGREIPIIADEHVAAEFGTGAVKVTPAHDPNDFEIGRRHRLDVVQVISEDATMTRQAGDYAGTDRYECRQALIEELRQKKLISRVEEHGHSVGHCYRCHTVIEPLVSLQWFVKMRPLADAALAAQDEGKITFHPPRWERIYRDWLENVRDWCISRQIWWGHRIPAWTCGECGELIVEREDPSACPKCGSDRLTQDEDVLDTWFSSGLWPFSTLGWPEETDDLACYYPTSLLVTDRGIIYFWVARMVMMGLELRDETPFSDVYIHGTILDEIGRKMSKSLGNGIDPIDMIERFGADAVRFSLIMLTVEGQDVKLSEDRFEMGRNFINKLWNAARFTLMNLKDLKGAGGADNDDLRLEDRWILSRFNATIEQVSTAFAGYHFNQAARAIYDFTWREFCDWYLEIVKPRMAGAGADGGPVAAVLTHCLDGLLRIMHPIAPFVTEEIWQKLREFLPLDTLAATSETSDMLMLASWPQKIDIPEHELAEQTMALLQGLIRGVRNIRSKMNIPESKPVQAFISAPDEETRDRLEAERATFTAMARINDAEIGVGLARPPASSVEVVGQVQLFVPLRGLIDIAEERARIGKRMEEAEALLRRAEGKLNNPQFIERAPDNVVEREREAKARADERLATLRHNLEELADEN